MECFYWLSYGNNPRDICVVDCTKYIPTRHEPGVNVGVKQEVALGYTVIEGYLSSLMIISVGVTEIHNSLTTSTGKPLFTRLVRRIV